VARVGARGAPVNELVSMSDDLSTEAVVIVGELAAASRLPDGYRRKALMETISASSRASAWPSA
jgi:hypothetical protein